MTLEDNQNATSQKTFSNPGVFNNSLVNGYISSLVNNCVPLTELSGPGVIGGTVTSGVVGCTAIAASAGATGAGLVGLANNGFVGGGAAAGVVGQGRAIANDNAALGGEFVASDVLNAGFTNIEILGTTTVTRTFNGSGNTIYEILDGSQQTAYFDHQPSFFWNGAPSSPIGNSIDCNTANSNQ